MELSGHTVDDLLRTAEQRLSQNTSLQLDRTADSSDNTPNSKLSTLGAGNKSQTVAKIEPRIVSTKDTQKVSNFSDQHRILGHLALPGDENPFTI